MFGNGDMVKNARDRTSGKIDVFDAAEDDASDSFGADGNKNKLSGEQINL